SNTINLNEKMEECFNDVNADGVMGGGMGLWKFFREHVYSNVETLRLWRSILIPQTIIHIWRR
ncbi:hypothetical protein U1Q18_012299, partial [Sarracenia purpurea var. burkii]